MMNSTSGGGGTGDMERMMRRLKMCNSIKSTLVTWLIMLSLFLSGCAGAYSPGVYTSGAAQAVVADGAPLSMGECKEIIRHASTGAQNTIALVRGNSYVFGELNSDGWRMVLATPFKEAQLFSNTRTLNYQEFLKALKDNGWEKLTPGLVAGVARAIVGIVGDFLVLPLGIFDNLQPEGQTVLG